MQMANTKKNNYETTRPIFGYSGDSQGKYYDIVTEWMEDGMQERAFHYTLTATDPKQ